MLCLHLTLLFHVDDDIMDFYLDYMMVDFNLMVYMHSFYVMCTFSYDDLLVFYDVLTFFMM